MYTLVNMMDRVMKISWGYHAWKRLNERFDDTMIDYSKEIIGWLFSNECVAECIMRSFQDTDEFIIIDNVNGLSMPVKKTQDNIHIYTFWNNDLDAFRISKCQQVLRLICADKVRHYKFYDYHDKKAS